MIKLDGKVIGDSTPNAPSYTPQTSLSSARSSAVLGQPKYSNTAQLYNMYQRQSKAAADRAMMSGAPANQTKALNTLANTQPGAIGTYVPPGGYGGLRNMQADLTRRYMSEVNKMSGRDLVGSNYASARADKIGKLLGLNTQLPRTSQQSSTSARDIVGETVSGPERTLDEYTQIESLFG